MSEKRYGLTKTETDRLNNLLSVARIQEEILNSLTLTYRAYLLDSVFPRLKLDVEEFPNSSVNLQEGELIVKETEKSTKK